jgi:hypothetical protein
VTPFDLYRDGAAELGVEVGREYPGGSADIVQLLVERVDVSEQALEVRIRAEGLVSLVGELRQQGERKAA